MFVCENGHEEIVINGFTKKNCPLCAANDTIEGLKQQVEDLETKVKSLEAELVEAQDYK